MIRQSLEDDSPYVMVAVSADHACLVVCAEGRYTASPLVSISFPCWIRLIREGNAFEGYISDDGISWNMLGVETVHIMGNSYAGMAITSDGSNRSGEAAFSDIQITGENFSQAWKSCDLGISSRRGKTSFSDDRCVIRSSKTKEADGRKRTFRYAFKSFDGDGSITARLDSLMTTLLANKDETQT